VPRPGARAGDAQLAPTADTSRAGTASSGLPRPAARGGAADEKAALAMVPESERANAKTQRVSKFTPKEAAEIHKKMAEKK
jgi:hypothetical protein